MKKILLSLFGLFALVASKASANPMIIPTPVPGPNPTCESAVGSTCAHWAIGDGAGGNVTANWVQGVYQDWQMCTLTNTATGVTCTLDTRWCPQPPPLGGDGHTFPNVIQCTGCSTPTGSILEAKCCLIYGTPTDPSGHPFC